MSTASALLSSFVTDVDRCSSRPHFDDCATSLPLVIPTALLFAPRAVGRMLAILPQSSHDLAVMGSTLLTMRPPLLKRSSAEAAGPGPQSTHAIAVDVKLHSGVSLHLDFSAGTPLAEVREGVWKQAQLPQHRQALVVCEERARKNSLASLAKRAHRRWQTRPPLSAVAASWANFILLPEAFNRELYGRGLIGWAKSTQWWQALSDAQNAAVAAGGVGLEAAGAAMLLRVELLAGEVVNMEVDPQCPLSDLQASVERQTGVLAEQQRMLVVERAGPGVVDMITSTLVLHGVSSLKGVVSWSSQMAVSAISRLHSAFSYPITVQSASGASFTMHVTGDTTMDQVLSLHMYNKVRIDAIQIAGWFYCES
ncbi:hypothetical protein WJX73_006155 [Symbiochloris irregularis]|uniref:Uncharacterized protein n=1 Tax=Symbiochloris irregularis TaxID=706552 RepID=A0AAW1NNI0_9CHLO